VLELVVLCLLLGGQLPDTAATSAADAVAQADERTVVVEE
jgi:hypothetical protein